MSNSNSKKSISWFEIDNATCDIEWDCKKIDVLLSELSNFFDGNKCTEPAIEIIRMNYIEISAMIDLVGDTVQKIIGTTQELKKQSGI